MSQPNRQEVAGLLYQALGEPVGLLLSSNDPAKGRQLLYTTRRELGDPALARLQFRLVMMEGEAQIAIVKGPAVAEPPPYEPLAGSASPNLGDLDL